MVDLPTEHVSLTQEILLHRIASRVRQSLELQEILLATVAEVRSFLGTDRVKIYQFQPDGHGLVIAESIQEGRLPPLLGLNFPADDIPPYARELFVRARQRRIVDLATHEIGISPLDNLETGQPLEEQDIRYRPVDPCHVEYLTAMDVMSSVVVPIVLQSKETGKDSLPSLRQSSQLWGLLVSHHSEPRVVTEQELQLIQSVVDQVAIAISQSILLNQVREQARQEAIINQVTEQLYTTPTVQLQAALEETVAAFAGSGGRLYLLPDNKQPTQIYTCGVQPAALDRGAGRPIEEHRLWLKYLYSATSPPGDYDSIGAKLWSVNWMRAVYALNPPPDERNSDTNLWAIADIYKEPLFRAITPCFQATQIRGLLIVPLLYASTVVGCLSIFRDEVDIETIWAGCVDTDSRQLMPRQSFEAWRELKTGQAQQWADADVKLAQALGERFSTAIKQYRLYQQVQALNTNLEQQVRDRTAELQQSNTDLQRSTIELQRSIERQQALARIIANMRQSLDVENIFRTTTEEICQLIKSDRLAVYRFNADWGGEFVSDYESANPRWQNNVKLGVNTVWDDTYLQETKGGRYRNNETFVVNDVYSMGFADCHIDLLEQFHVKAFIITPIFVGQELWGLLGVYQHSSSRHWEVSEVEFFKQIATQLGVALQQAEYVEQVRSQTQQLALVAEQQQTLASVITKVRESLDLNEIFETTTQELRRVLNADRVVVFRFYSEFSYEGGEVIAEDVASHFPSTLAAKVYDRCVGEQYTKKFCHGYIHAVADIYNSELDDCYISMLSRFWVRANLVVPMLKQGNLWGLLCIHQCEKSRKWQESEIEFVSQIASQLGVALQHAVLLKHTQQQATQLSQTLDNLKQTQTQLIHSEKMSSLGQLVAGVAHEINNPVNFIYGNLSHIHEYTQNLIEMLNLYQQHYPEPNPEIKQRAKVTDLEFIAEDLPKLFASLKLGAERIYEIVLSLRNFSRLDHAEVKSVNIHEGIDSTLLILQHRLKLNSLHSGIEVVKQYGDLPLVECFAGQLNQVFMNLIANAIDALEDICRQSIKSGAKKHYPVINIKTQRIGDDRIQISIKDNGFGISQEVQTQLFNPFFTTKPVGQGTGLGLSISHQIIEKHGGKLQCVSQPGEGAEFIIDIPIRQFKDSK
ncbi:MAG: GAF domain-containing protein [Desmonostoc vinosum HA7617-LM4]|jgi:GAF domain-containing protein|nr:GAF domain-containing protein [Desmonostoc vinosum HA7617-LM4]